MRSLTLILAYYENPGMLREQLRCLSSLPDKIKSGLQLIVVDDGSPTSPAWHEDVGFPFELYRMQVDVRWNQDACRNLGAHHAKTKWLLLTDIDHLVPEATFAGLQGGEFEAGRVYRFSRASLPDLSEYKPHPNSWFLSRGLYEKIGGYDERFAGFYGTDADFRDRAERVAGKTITLPLRLVRVPREVIPDASTTTYQRKAPEDLENIPRIRAARAQIPGWRPLTLQFPWERVA